MTDRATPPRAHLTTRKFASNADADRYDLEFWRQMPPHERVLQVWRLSVEQWELLDRPADEPGLCRSAASVRRR